MRVALVQFAAGTDPTENIAAATKLLDGVEADLIILPEAVMHDFGSPETAAGAGRPAAGRPVRCRAGGAGPALHVSGRRGDVRTLG